LINVEQVHKEVTNTLFPIREFLDLDGVNEVEINPGGKVFVERNGIVTYEGVKFTDDDIDLVLRKISTIVGKSVNSEGQPD
jgi:Flp pilus assembly CpaF family ATPase